MDNTISLLIKNNFLSAQSFNIQDCFSDYTSKFNFKRHIHEFYEMEFIYDGHAHYEINGEDYTFDPGTVCLLTPLDFHQQKLAAPESIRYYNIIFTEDILSREIINLLYSLKKPLLINYSHQEFKDLLSLVQVAHAEHLASTCANPLLYGNIVMRNLIENICIRFIRSLKINASCDEMSNVDHTISLVLSYIRSHHHHKITLQDVANHVCLSPAYLSSYFSKVMNVSFTVFLKNYRLNLAASLIQTTTIPLNQIALETGFKTFTYFSAAFKEYFHLSPSDYRKEKTIR